VLAYRIDNGLDRLPTISDKVGTRFARLAQSPLIKADAAQINLPFTAYGTIFAQLPSPAIFHPVAFQPGGHDENYPDFLPPANAFGSTSEFASMMSQGQAAGLFMMPYTNPTWWDDQSPTMQSLPTPLQVADVAALDSAGTPLYEWYGSRGGYVMSPAAPFVAQRLDQLATQMTTALPSDFLFEDQVGARPWLFDSNASEADPSAYIDGWLQHTRTHSSKLLMTELGFDRLAESEVGFHGSVVLPDRLGYTPGWWGTGTWHAYPLATMMVRDKVLFYQHDLAPETMTKDKATLTWNLALGYMLSYDPSSGGLANPWLGVVGTFQKHVLSRYAGERLMAFASVATNVTKTEFATFTVTANWDAAASYSTDGFTLPPQGVMTGSRDGTVRAGVFTTFNGVALDAGDHYLIEERTPSTVVVRQPMGSDTNITVRLPAGWTVTDPLAGRAFDGAGRVIQDVAVSTTTGGIMLNCQQQRAGQSVAAYRLRNHSRLTFVDDPLTPRETTVKAIHIEELRERVNALRQWNGLEAATWSTATESLRGLAVGRAQIEELRSALDPVYVALGQPTPSYTDASPIGGSTLIKAAHVAELRAAVAAVW
jgi:hypothetical protein